MPGTCGVCGDRVPCTRAGEAKSHAFGSDWCPGSGELTVERARQVESQASKARPENPGLKGRRLLRNPKRHGGIHRV